MLLRYPVLLFSLLGPFILSAQSPQARLDSLEQKITGSLSAYYKSYPQEKTFIHLDQNTYLAGERAWYEVFAMAYGEPSKLSKIVYVRLSDANGKFIKQDKHPLINSLAYGNMDLPDSLPSGWYQLHAFTAWMLNFGEDGFFHQDIYIKNNHQRDTTITALHQKKAYQLKFYPEGGGLVEGNIGNIAFKATDENGQPVNIYAELLANNKKTNVKLETVHDGMGSFELEPLATAGYMARVHFPDSSVQNIVLPEIKKAGVSMRVNTANDLEVKISYSGPQQEYGHIILAAVQGNGLSVVYPLTLNKGINIFSFKKKYFSTGLLRLTIFDAAGQRSAERTVFINNNDQLKLTLNKDTLALGPEEKNVFTLHIADEKNRPLKANISVAITDAGSGTLPDDNISSCLLMRSELRGFINQPAYYFKDNNDSLKQQLDLVMLTNSWRHFKWDTIFRDKHIPLKYAVEGAQLISGKIDNYNEQVHRKIKLMINNEDSTKYLGFVEPDSTGRFILTNYNHRGTARIYYEVLNAKNKKQLAKVIFFKRELDTVVIARDTLKRLTAKTSVFIKPPTDSAAKAQNGKEALKGIVLKTVNIKAQTPSPTDLLIQSHVKHLVADNAYTLDLVNSDAPTMDFMSYIQGRFPGLQVIISTMGIFFEYHGISTLSGDYMNEGGGQHPYFYIDEAPATFEEVAGIPLVDVALIRFAPPPVWFAPLNGGFIGAILVYTKRFGDEKYPGLNNLAAYGEYNFKGYSLTREFSARNLGFTAQKPATGNLNTLYWGHNLVTDKHGNFKIQFNNNGKAKKFRVVINALAADGSMGSLTEEF